MQIPRKMSAHNVMASISRTLGTRHADSRPPNEVKFAGEESKDKLYEPKHKQKLVRVLTVVAYIISVSLAAIVLSLYYMYIWDPSDHPHYVAAKQRANATAPAAIGGGAPRTPCLDVVTPATMLGPRVPSSVAGGKIYGTSYDKSSSPSTSTDSSVDPQVSDTKLEDAVKNLFKTLITPSSRPDADASLSSPSWPELPSISSDQFQAVPRANDDYHDDSTVESGDDLLDD